MAKRLYIGNLPYSADDEQLRELFEQAGEVTSVTVMTESGTGRSRGFGFVEMATEEAAQEAINRFNGYMMGDRALNVNEARPREERQGGGRRRDERARSGGGSRRRY